MPNSSATSPTDRLASNRTAAVARPSGTIDRDYSYALMDLTVFGRQEDWEDSPTGWPHRGHATRTAGGAPDWPPLVQWPGGRPTSQWSRLDAGHTDDLGTAGADEATPPPACH